MIPSSSASCLLRFRCNEKSRMTPSPRGSMRARLLVPVMATMLALAPRAAQSQVPDRHHALWVTTGLGVGTSSISCDECVRGDLGEGLTATIGVGFALTPRLSLAVGTNGWLKTTDGVMDRIGYFTAVMRYYFGPDLYLGAGGGLAHHRAGIKRSGPSATREGITQFAPALQVEGGYDIRLGSQLILSPFVSLNRSLSADLKKEGRSLGVKATLSTIQAGVAISWNWSQPLR